MKTSIRILMALLIALMSGCNKDPFFTGDSGTFKDSRDKNEYQWIKIGSQIWMAENLAYLPTVYPLGITSQTEAQYYVAGYDGSSVSEAKAHSNFNTYGVLYNWEAAKKACPAGWHLPTDEEWQVLEKSLGMTEVEAGDTGFRGSGSVGGKLKETGTAHWASPNAGANNSSEFSALPGGARGFDGQMYDFGYLAYFWTSTIYGTEYAWDRMLEYDNDGIRRGYFFPVGGFSVRCVKD